MRNNVLLLTLIFGLILTTGTVYALDSDFQYFDLGQSCNNPVEIVVEEGSPIIVDVEYSEIPFVLPIDGSPAIIPLVDVDSPNGILPDGDKLSVIPFDESRPLVYRYKIVAEVPSKMFKGELKMKFHDQTGMLFIPNHEKVLIIRIWEKTVLPHTEYLTEQYEVYHGNLIIKDSILALNKGLADEPMILPEGTIGEIVIPLEGGGGPMIVPLNGGYPYLFEGEMKVVGSVVIGEKDGKINIYKIIDSGSFKTFEDLRDGIIEATGVFRRTL